MLRQRLQFVFIFRSGASSLARLQSAVGLLPHMRRAGEQNLSATVLQLFKHNPLGRFGSVFGDDVERAGF